VRSCEMRQGNFDSWCACSAKKRHPALHSARNTDQSECRISPYHTIERLLKLCRGTTRLILCYGELNLAFSLYIACLSLLLLVSQHEPWIQPARQYVLGTLVCALAQTCLTSPTIFTQVSKLVTLDHIRHCFPTAWYLDASPKGTVPLPNTSPWLRPYLSRHHAIRVPHHDTRVKHIIHISYNPHLQSLSRTHNRNIPV
jgi:hypothetical protein